eukprot:863210-Rhodomonas_salina.2
MERTSQTEVSSASFLDACYAIPGPGIGLRRGTKWYRVGHTRRGTNAGVWEYQELRKRHRSFEHVPLSSDLALVASYLLSYAAPTRSPGGCYAECGG